MQSQQPKAKVKICWTAANEPVLVVGDGATEFTVALRVVNASRPLKSFAEAQVPRDAVVPNGHVTPRGAMHDLEPVCELPLWMAPQSPPAQPQTQPVTPPRRVAAAAAAAAAAAVVEAPMTPAPPAAAAAVASPAPTMPAPFVTPPPPPNVKAVTKPPSVRRSGARTDAGEPRHLDFEDMLYPVDRRSPSTCSSPLKASVGRLEKDADAEMAKL